MLEGRRLHDMAIASFNAAMTLDPKSAAAYGNRGYVYLQENRLDLAVPDFDQALQLDPKQIMGLEGKAVIARRNGDPAAAVAVLTHVLELYPDEAWAHEERAEVLAQLQRYDEALKEMNLLLGKKPKDPVWLNDRCWYRAIAGKELAIALADCDASLKMKEVPAVRDSRGLVNLRLGKFDAAMADYDKALAEKPNQPSSLYGRGIAKLKKGAVIDGKADITAALAIDPKVEKQFAGYGVTP